MVGARQLLRVVLWLRRLAIPRGAGTARGDWLP
jgi:hypothetical protein